MENNMYDRSKIPCLADLIIDLYKTLNDIEKVETTIFLYVRSDIQNMAISRYGTENYVETIIEEYVKNLS